MGRASGCESVSHRRPPHFPAGEFVSEALLVPEGCRFLHQERMDQCESSTQRQQEAQEVRTQPLILPPLPENPGFQSSNTLLLHNLSLSLSPLSPVGQNQESRLQAPSAPKTQASRLPLHPSLPPRPSIYAHSSHRPAAPRASSCMAQACFCPVAQIGSEVWNMSAAHLQQPPTLLGQQSGE